MKTESAKQKERRINEMLIDSYSEEQLVDELIYLTTKSRSDYTTESNIRKQYYNRNLAALIRRLDPIRYNLM